MTSHWNNGFLSRVLRLSAAPALQQGILPAARGSVGAALHASPLRDPPAITPAPHTDDTGGNNLRHELAWRETVKKFAPQSSSREDSPSQVATEVERPSDASAFPATSTPEPLAPSPIVNITPAAPPVETEGATAYPAAHTSPELAATRPRHQAEATTNAPTTTVSSRVGPPEIIYERVFVDDATARTRAAPPGVTGPTTSNVETRSAPFRPVDASRPGPPRADITKTLDSPAASAPSVAGQARITSAETIPERPSLEDVDDARASGVWPRRPVSIHFENLEPPAPPAPREPPPPTPEATETQTTRRVLLPADAPADGGGRERRVEVVTHTAAKNAGPQPSSADTRATNPRASDTRASVMTPAIQTPATLTPAARPQEQLQTLSGPRAQSSRPRDEAPRVTIGRLDIQIIEQPPAPAEPPPLPSPPPPPPTDFRETLDRRHLGNIGLRL